MMRQKTKFPFAFHPDLNLQVTSMFFSIGFFGRRRVSALERKSSNSTAFVSLSKNWFLPDVFFFPDPGASLPRVGPQHDYHAADGDWGRHHRLGEGGTHSDLKIRMPNMIWLIYMTMPAASVAGEGAHLQDLWGMDSSGRVYQSRGQSVAASLLADGDLQTEGGPDQHGHDWRLQRGDEWFFWWDQRNVTPSYLSVVK